MASSRARCMMADAGADGKRVLGESLGEGGHEHSSVDGGRAKAGGG